MEKDEPLIKVKISDIKEIIRLNQKDYWQLRGLNPERAYNGNNLNKAELIYQIVFLRDAPNK